MTQYKGSINITLILDLTLVLKVPLGYYSVNPWTAGSVDQSVAPETTASGSQGRLKFQSPHGSRRGQSTHVILVNPWCYIGVSFSNVTLFNKSLHFYINSKMHCRLDKI